MKAVRYLLAVLVVAMTTAACNADSISGPAAPTGISADSAKDDTGIGSPT